MCYRGRTGGTDSIETRSANLNGAPVRNILLPGISLKFLFSVERFCWILPRNVRYDFKTEVWRNRARSSGMPDLRSAVQWLSRMSSEDISLHWVSLTLGFVEQWNPPKYLGFSVIFDAVFHLFLCLKNQHRKHFPLRCLTETASSSSSSHSQTLIKKKRLSLFYEFRISFSVFASGSAFYPLSCFSQFLTNWWCSWTGCSKTPLQNKGNISMFISRGKRPFIHGRNSGIM